MADIDEDPTQAPRVLEPGAPLQRAADLDFEVKPAAPVDGDRIVIATIGVGVPLPDATEFAEVLVAAAIDRGYLAVEATLDQVSGVHPDRHGSTPDVCPVCRRQIRRYTVGGTFYRHHCKRPEEGSR